MPLYIIVQTSKLTGYKCVVASDIPSREEAHTQINKDWLQAKPTGFWFNVVEQGKDLTNGNLE